MKTEQLLPKVRPYFEKFISALDKKGLRYSVLEVFRTQAVQDAYYAQGRESVEEVNRLRKLAGLWVISPAEAGRVITRAKHSLHQERIAADIVPVLENGKIPWNITSREIADLWLAFGRLGTEAGLDWGGTWKPLNAFGIGWDAPHYEKRTG
jgi:peptidoglycan L-alanyl-D-glutamate endopeptidase CwlK